MAIPINMLGASGGDSLSPRTFKSRFGVGVGEWAKERAYEPKLVYAVMAGKRKCLRGDSLRIAIELGLKR